MPVLKLTKRNVDALAPARSVLTLTLRHRSRGLWRAVTPTGAKSWIVEYRPHGGGRGVAKSRVTLGKVGALTPDQARRTAADMLAPFDLAAIRRLKKPSGAAAVTVGELLDLFDEQYVGPMLKPGTAVSHRIALAELRRAHGALKAEALTRAHVAALHARMSDRPFAANRAVAVWSKAFAWGATRGLVPEGHNPTKGLQKYREQGRERYLTSDELARLGAALAEGETIGLPYEVDEIETKGEARRRSRKTGASSSTRSRSRRSVS